MFHYWRYWILFISVASMTLLFGNIMAFNFTIICMMPPPSPAGPPLNSAHTNSSAELNNMELNIAPSPRPDEHYDYGPLEKNLLFSAVALGSLVSGPFVSPLITRFGLKKTYLAYGWASAAMTLLIPLSARLGFMPLFIVRTVQGCGMAALLAVISAVSERWAPRASVDSYMLLLSVSLNLSPMIAMPVAGVVCTSSLGWPFVYYLQGGVTAALLLLFHLLFWDTPDSPGSRVSPKELDLIQKGSRKSSLNSSNSSSDSAKGQVSPYRAIFLDPIVWVTLATFSADELAYTTLSQYGPLYLHNAVGMDVHSTGWAAALPHLVAIASKLLVGPINDRMSFVSDERRTKMWAAISTLGAMFCFASLAVLPKIDAVKRLKWLLQVVFTSVNVFTSLCFLGVLKSAIMISRQHTHVLMTAITVLSDIIMLSLPLAVGVLAPRHSIDEWSRIFLGISALQAVTITIFITTCDSKPREWTRDETKKTAMFHYWRYWILFISVASMTLLFGNIMAFNFTIICMMPPPAGPLLNTISSAELNKMELRIAPYPRSDEYYDYSPLEKNLLFSAVALGSLVSGPLVSPFVTRFGLKKTYLAYGWASTAMTLLLPLSARLGFIPLFIVRTVQGCGMAALLAMIGGVSEHWAPTAAVGSYILLLSTPFQLGPVLAMPVAGVVCTSSLGWPFVYYLQGGVTTALLLLFHLFFWDTPDSPRSRVSQKELNLIQKSGRKASLNSSNSSSDSAKGQVSPYRAIFLDPIVWVTLATFSADELAYTTLSQYGPLYLHNAVGMDVHSTGWAAALPHLVAIASKLLVGPINDRMSFVSDERRTKMWAAISTLGAMFCFASLAVLPMAIPKWLLQVVFTSVNAFTSLGFLGVLKSAIVISRQHSHVLMTAATVLSSIIMVVLPLAVSILAPRDSIAEWSRIFIGICALQAVTITGFIATCDSKPRKWA